MQQQQQQQQQQSGTYFNSGYNINIIKIMLTKTSLPKLNKMTFSLLQLFQFVHLHDDVNSLTN